MIQQILVVCEGNICRSPMAEALFRTRGHHAISAGLNALVGKAPPEDAREAMQVFGIDISKHRGQQITQALCTDADLILVMDNGQKRNVESRFPRTRGKVFRIGEHTNIDIADPFRQSRSAFDRCAQTIASGVADWVSRLAHL
ncbi:low molecular weight protein-tyrosine-phosphatase [Paraburkholderia sp. J7]|uniref:low molecular weight protein-tyrosine-phosphatase n=1 Tax=Paraburkholderia sp. J7 TaxID=2805438 RepID=UPI002AB70DB3|nr:low molecular weight protein-tyrosine-phosphatase [Paraburkholderia sp. J7]